MMEGPPTPGTTDPGTTEPDTTAPGELVNLKATKITNGNGCAVTFAWEDPSDSDFMYVRATYNSTSGGTMTYTYKGALRIALNDQKTNEISSYIFQTRDKTGNFSKGITVEVFIPAAGDWDITYINNNDKDNLNTLLKPTGYYILEEDIILNNDGNPNWTPVENFTGILCGNGHSISNVTITDKGSSSYFGFFSNTGNGSVVRDLVLKNINVTSNHERSGTLAGYVGTGSRIINCGASGTVTSTAKYTGGLLGWVEEQSVIQYCYADVDVVGARYVGGFAGRIYNVNDCYALGNVEGTSEDNPTNNDGDCVGGFAGYVRNSAENCYSAGAVKGVLWNVHGFAGIFYKINNCYFNSELAGVEKGDGSSDSKSIDLTNKSLFAGFDFTSKNPVWSIDSSINGGMPYLTSFKP